MMEIAWRGTVDGVGEEIAREILTSVGDGRKANDAEKSGQRETRQFESMMLTEIVRVLSNNYLRVIPQVTVTNRDSYLKTY